MAITGMVGYDNDITWDAVFCTPSKVSRSEFNERKARSITDFSAKIHLLLVGVDFVH